MYAVGITLGVIVLSTFVLVPRERFTMDIGQTRSMSQSEREALKLLSSVLTSLKVHTQNPIQPQTPDVPANWAPSHREQTVPQKDPGSPESHQGQGARASNGQTQGTGEKPAPTGNWNVPGAKKHFPNKWSKSCTSDKKNVLFLIVDDLTGDLPLRKYDQFLMPNGQRLYIPYLKQLAENSLVFRAAYNQYPLCNPSRSSMLTGRRPETTHVYSLRQSFRLLSGNFTTLPEYFKQHGYHSIGLGKVFHYCLGDPPHLRRDPQSWSQTVEAGAEWDTYWRERVGGGWKGVPKARRRQHQLPDDLNVHRAIEMLRDYADTCRPFFLAVGFYKPHEPIVFPEEMLDYYPLHTIKLPLIMQHEQGITNRSLDMYNSLAYQTSENIIESQRFKEDGSNWEDVFLRWRQAYFSAVTYLDQLVGRILDVLDETGLANNTVVNFMSDHGVKMGDHGGWGKAALFDADTRVPWIMRIPGVTDAGIQIDHPVELVDVFPTLIGAAGLPPIPMCPGDSNRVKTCHEGMDILSVMNGDTLDRKRPAFSQVTRDDGMGNSVRTKDYRYTEYGAYDYWLHRPKWNLTYESELFDYRVEGGEGTNRLNDPRYQGLRRALQSILHAGWRDSIQIPIPELDVPVETINKSRVLDESGLDATLASKSNLGKQGTYELPGDGAIVTQDTGKPVEQVNQYPLYQGPNKGNLFKQDRDNQNMIKQNPNKDVNKPPDNPIPVNQDPAGQSVVNE